MHSPARTNQAEERRTDTKKTISLALVLALCLSLCACCHTHEFSAWTVVSEATCTADGSRERTCECGEKETEVLKAAGHQYGEAVEIKAASCTEDGQTEKTCAVCGSAKPETVAAWGHSSKAATAFRPKTCSTCGVTEGEALAKVVQTGDAVDAEDHKFVVEDVNFTKDLKVKKGNTTYHYGKDGYFLLCKLDFTNLAAETMESWNSDRIVDMKLTYADKYSYDGECWIPEREIVPLDNDVLFILFPVSEAIETGSESLTFTFTVDGSEFTFNVR